MIRIIGNRIMLAKGDTGLISIPNIFLHEQYSVAVLTVYDKLYRTKVIEKITRANQEFLSFSFNSKDTQQLEPRTYYYDITIYCMPTFDEDGFPIDGEIVDSYYGARLKLPKFIIKGGI